MQGDPSLYVPIREPQLGTFLGRALEAKLLHLRPGRPLERSGPKRSSGCDDLALPGKPFSTGGRTGRGRLKPHHETKTSQKWPPKCWKTWARYFDPTYSLHSWNGKNSLDFTTIIPFYQVSKISHGKFQTCPNHPAPSCFVWNSNLPTDGSSRGVP